jgi:hypothetical protein
MVLAEKLIEAFNSATEFTYQYKYNKTNLGLRMNGSASNFMSVVPRRRDVTIWIKVERTDEVDNIMAGRFGGRYHDSGWYSMSLKNQLDKNDENLEALKPVFAQAEKDYFKK